MRAEPQPPHARVVLRHDMPSSTCIWTESAHGPRAVYYANAEKVTERQRELLEAALNGDVTMEEMLARWAI